MSYVCLSNKNPFYAVSQIKPFKLDKVTMWLHWPAALERTIPGKEGSRYTSEWSVFRLVDQCIVGVANYEW